MRKCQFVVAGFTVLGVLASCGGGGDDCERVFNKMKPMLEKMGKEKGKTLGDAEKTKFLEKCRASMKDGTSEDKAMMKCILDAADDKAVATCMEAPFQDYMKKSKKSEAELQLNKLGKNAKVSFQETSQFPVGKAGPTPSAGCCGQPGGKCPPSPSDWANDKTWSTLDFAIDEPSYFQYSYESDGKTFKATAVGDLDCDTTMVTYTIEGKATDGAPTVTLTPPANTD